MCLASLSLGSRGIYQIMPFSQLTPFHVYNVTIIVGSCDLVVARNHLKLLWSKLKPKMIKILLWFLHEKGLTFCTHYGCKASTTLTLAAIPVLKSYLRACVVDSYYTSINQFVELADKRVVLILRPFTDMPLCHT